jgi:hypothetical protein
MDDLTIAGRAAKTKASDDPGERILALARAHGVTYQPTALDALGNAITRLAGDDVNLNEPALALIALERAGYLTPGEAARLHGEYLNTKFG